MPISYLDNNATTRPDERVVSAVMSMLTDNWGNPSSAHYFGAQVAVRIEEARRHVAGLIGARANDIVFTSGGTEADNTALRGVLAAQPDKRYLIISAVEHHAIFETAEQLELEGVTVTRIGVDQEGRLELEALKDALRDDTALISIMLANNETGVVFPIKQVSEIAQRRGVPVHTDAVNALGKIPVNVDDLGVDLLSLSSHKIYGPKGVGALYIRPGMPYQKWQIGGAQERDRRGGTLNAPGIIGLGTACQLLRQQSPEVNTRIAALRDRLEAELAQRCPTVHFIGQRAERLPNTTCVCFEGLLGETIVVLLSEVGVCVSSGAACAAGGVEPSHVLRAMRIDPGLAGGEIRFSLGRNNVEADVDRLVEILPTVLEKAAETERI
ncbi:MAG: aminotransferase class V-fold PLP-dependent enzyme [Phycisphaerae bacterium]|nr:aminotransferase class V-fold PLP-dependent enzyme [Phycisphaerae bacterium]